MKKKKKKRVTRWETAGTVSILSLSPFKISSQTRKKKKIERRKYTREIDKSKMRFFHFDSGFCLEKRKSEKKDEEERKASDHLAERDVFIFHDIIEKKREEQIERRFWSVRYNKWMGRRECFVLQLVFKFLCSLPVANSWRQEKKYNENEDNLDLVDTRS